MAKDELAWRHIGSGIWAKTFINVYRLPLTTRSGPPACDIEWRKVVDVVSGKVVDKCRVDDTADSVLMRCLGVPRTVRVELTLKESQKWYRAHGPDVVEIFSPPRVVQEAGLRSYGGVQLNAGWSSDLTMNDPINGKPWDLSKPEKVQRLLHLMEVYKPFVVLGSPQCTVFSSLRNLTREKRPASVMQAEWDEAIHYLKVCMRVYNMQVDGGRYFVHEHPLAAGSWDLDIVRAVQELPGVQVVKTDLCQFGMTAVGDDGVRRPVMKPTRVMTNAPEIAKRIQRRCPNRGQSKETRHEHTQLIGGKARQAAVYPKAFCQCTCQGIVAQKQHRSNGVMEMPLMDVSSMEKLAEKVLERVLEDESASQALHEDVSDDVHAYDDVSGAELDARLVETARREEIDYFKSMGVYRKVPIEQARQATGKNPIAVRWVDINKGDSVSPNYRSRLVANEFRTEESIFAATPPSECLRFLLSRLATKNKGYKLMYADVSRVIFTHRLCGQCTFNCQTRIEGLKTSTCAGNCAWVCAALVTRRGIVRSSTVTRW